VGTGGDEAEEGVVVEQIDSTLLFFYPLLLLLAAKTSIAIYPRRFGTELWHRTGWEHSSHENMIIDLGHVVTSPRRLGR
jgi:hypothetical protein